MRELFANLALHAQARCERIALSDDRGAMDFHTLALRVAAVRDSLPESARTVALVGHAGASWIVADLAATLAACRVVPIPSFFSNEQMCHVLTDSAAQLLLSCDSALGGFYGGSHLPVHRVDAHAHVCASEHARLTYTGGAERVIYTSGTTGTPRGVLHGDRQMGHAIQAISAAVAANAKDVHLSALPASLLLEQIAGVFIPLMVGGRIHVSASATQAAMIGDLQPLLTLFSELAPSTTVLVPQLLAAMTTAARDGVWTPARSLRVAAVGGAPIPLTLVREARALGIPVIRGYGLSECASVVCVERPGDPVDDTEGACGKVLSGVRLNVIDGEVVVSGPTVMNGYLNAAPLNSNVWRTGDKGRIAADGTVVITGRCDRILVLPNGRNVASDWVEAVVLVQPRYDSARVAIASDGLLTLDAVIRPAAKPWFSAIDNAALQRHLHELFAQLPAYARPARIRLACAGAPTRDIELALTLTAPSGLYDPCKLKETDLV
ncbi:MAG: long-subunit acyl-CoA synthetase (AMP-forming) [Gammaproteobacteria bacterium]